MLKEDTPGYTGTAYLLVQLMGSSYLNILEFHNNAWCLYHMTMLLTCGPFSVLTSKGLRCILKIYQIWIVHEDLLKNLSSDCRYGRSGVTRHCSLQGQLCLWFWPKRKLRMILRIKITLQKRCCKNGVAGPNNVVCRRLNLRSLI